MGKIRKYWKKTTHKMRGGTTGSHVLILEQRRTTMTAPSALILPFQEREAC